VYRPGNGVESPRLLRSVRPNYTAEAMRAKVQGVVRLEGVVLRRRQRRRRQSDALARSSVRPRSGSDQGSQTVPLRAGTRFGEPVAVLVSFEIEFTLR
jgi:hypothetical protein